MYDLYTPSDRYEEEVVKLEKALGEIDDNKEFVCLSVHLLFGFLKNLKLLNYTSRVSYEIIIRKSQSVYTGVTMWTV